MAVPIQPKSKKQKIVSIRLNWRAYFETFCQEHGDDPVVVDNRLLFRDGWMYSAHDFQGPEYRPPKDTKELERMQLQYWNARIIIVEDELKELRRMRDGLNGFQTSKSVPLQQSVTFTDDDGKRGTIVQDIDMGLFQERIMWLVEDRKECQEHITELKRGILK